MRSRYASNIGTVKAVSPCDGLNTIPFFMSELRIGATLSTFLPKRAALSPERCGPGPSFAMANRYAFSVGVKRSNRRRCPRTRGKGISDRIHKFLIGPYESYLFQDNMAKNIQYSNLTPDLGRQIVSYRSSRSSNGSSTHPVGCRHRNWDDRGTQCNTRGADGPTSWRLTRHGWTGSLGKADYTLAAA